MGRVQVRTEQVCRFVSPILGFEAYRAFAILPDPAAAPFHWLQSLEDKRVAFPVVSAGEIGMVYSGNEDVLGAVGASSWHDVECWLIVVFPSDRGPMRMNLRAPVLVHRRTRSAAQGIVREEYPVSYAVDACAVGAA